MPVTLFCFSPPGPGLGQRVWAQLVQRCAAALGALCRPVGGPVCKAVCASVCTSVCTAVSDAVCKALLVWATLTLTPAVAQTLPSARDLPAELAQALRQGQPLVVMVSLDGCPFCRMARQSHLLPMQREGLAIVQVDMRSAQTLRDFDGQPSTHDALVQRWRVTIAPTLLFFGPGGRELAERMEGAYQPDFYGPYLEQRLEKSRQALRR